jgi:hypothetical protein
MAPRLLHRRMRAQLQCNAESALAISPQRTTSSAGSELAYLAGKRVLGWRRAHMCVAYLGGFGEACAGLAKGPHVRGLPWGFRGSMRWAGKGPTCEACCGLAKGPHVRGSCCNVPVMLMFLPHCRCDEQGIGAGGSSRGKGRLRCHVLRNPCTRPHPSRDGSREQQGETREKGGRVK